MWIIFEVGESEDLTDREVVFLREQDIRRVRIRRQRGDKAVGFAVGEVVPPEDPDTAS